MVLYAALCAWAKFKRTLHPVKIFCFPAGHTPRTYVCTTYVMGSFIVIQKSTKSPNSFVHRATYRLKYSILRRFSNAPLRENHCGFVKWCTVTNVVNPCFLSVLRTFL